MLGDDIMDGTKSGIRAVGHAIANAAKGALIFGLIAAAASLVVAAVAVGGPMGLVGAKVIGATLVGAAQWAGAGAVIGGAITGVASLIPGTGERFWSKLFARKPHESRSPQHDMGASVPQESRYASTGASRSEHSERSEAPVNPYMRPQHTTVVDNSRTEVYSGNEAPRTAIIRTAEAAPVQPQAEALAAPQDAANDPSYFRPGKGMELLQKGNERRSDTALAK